MSPYGGRYIHSGHEGGWLPLVSTTCEVSLESSTTDGSHSVLCVKQLRKPAMLGQEFDDLIEQASTSKLLVRQTPSAACRKGILHQVA